MSRRLTPDYLYRFGKPFPQHRRAQNVVPIDHRLHRPDIAVQPFAGIEAELGQQIGIAVSAHQVMEEDAFLQRGQRIDILHVAAPPGTVPTISSICSGVSCLRVHVAGICDDHAHRFVFLFSGEDA